VHRPVLVMGRIPRIVLPIARSLRQYGIPVDVVSFSPCPPILSRAVREHRTLPPPDADRQEFLRQLRRFIVENRHDMLIPTDDWVLTGVVEHYDDLADLLHLCCPPPSISKLVLNKIETLRIAQNCGMNVPETTVVSTASELHDVIGRIPFPWVVKPAWRETRAENLKSATLASAEEVRASFPAGDKFAPPLLVQEYCAGAGIGVELLLHQGKCLAAFQHRRLKEMPHTGGVSVTAVAEPLNDDLMQSALSLLEELHWDGIAMVEYKVSSDGHAAFMEVNGRYWGTIGLAISAGIDFPLYQWQLAHGEKPTIPGSYASATKWRSTVDYIWRLHNLLDRAQSGSGEARQVLFEDVRQVLKDFAPQVHDATFRFSDPMPFTTEIVRALTHIIADGARRASSYAYRRGTAGFRQRLDSKQRTAQMNL